MGILPMVLPNVVIAGLGVTACSSDEDSRQFYRWRRVFNRSEFDVRLL